MILPNWKKYKRTQKGKGFDQSKADAAIGFIQHYLTHTKGRWAGEAFDLLDWQIELLTELFGRVNKDGNRQYRLCYVEIPKKNGKSELAAAIALYLQTNDGEKGAEIYSAAADRDQAAIVFNVAAQMVRNDDDLAGALKLIDSQKRMVDYQTGNVYRVLSSESHTKHGINAHGMVFDELHAQPNRDLWDTLTYGSGLARTQPLTFVITTAGFDRNSICWELHERARRIMKGISEDPTFLPVIYGLEDKDDWEKEKNWLKVNPSTDIIFSADSLRDDYRLALEIPAQESEFKRKRLNLWTASDVPWLNMKKWDACNLDFNERSLEGRMCYSGLDLSSTIDLTALAHVFPPITDREPYKVIIKFWIPEDNMWQRTKRDKVPYDIWTREKYITTTPGDIIDYTWIRHELKEDKKKYEIKEVAYDPHNARQLMLQIRDEDDFEIIEIAQNWGMSEPAKDLEVKIASKQIAYNTNPVLRWMADNVVVHIGPSGNYKPDKRKSTEKIDGIIALIMALHRATINTDSTSKYEDEGMVVL